MGRIVEIKTPRQAAGTDFDSCLIVHDGVHSAIVNDLGYKHAVLKYLMNISKPRIVRNNELHAETHVKHKVPWLYHVESL